MSAHTQTANRWMKPLPLLGLLLTAGLILSIAVLTVPAVVESRAAAPGIEASILRARQADAARYTGLAATYAARQAANLERSHLSEAARWNLMAKNFAAKQASNLERSRLAEAARWNLMAAHSEIGEVISLERARVADAARWNLMAEYFAAKP